MKTYIVGNWKMNFNVGEASVYLHKLQRKIANYRDVKVVVVPPALALQPLSLQLDRSKIKLGAQNAYFQDFGAYTGEISFAELKGLVDYCIIGHSERRNIFHEDDKMIARKVAAAIRHKITPILCIGELESERSFGETASVISGQLLGGLSEIGAEDVSKVIVAYEPVWAISSTKDAKIATPDEIFEVVQMIRGNLKEVYGAETAEEVPVLFGGSVKTTNVGAYLTVPGINGVLVGGASLILDEFVGIIETAKRVRI